MGNGKEEGDKNIESFRSWVAGKSDVEFVDYVYRGQLSRTDIAKECGFGRSALIQNPTIKKELSELEKRLREADILPKLSETTDTIPTGCTTTKKEDDRIKRLECENALLKAELAKKNEFIKHYGMIEQFMTETMRLPR
ncbi:MAG: VPA1267 family protein [Dissulfurispiraceae bacterium]